MLLQDLYNSEIKKKLMDKFNYSSIMAIPKLSKITLNIGLSDSSDKKSLENAVNDMKLISGQSPVITKVRKSIAGFKIRDGWPIGCKVTLRREKMWSFFNALVLISIPRIRDFRGFSVKSFDGRGNYSLGISEQIIFPEIDYDKIDKMRGLDVCITTSAKNNEEGEALLRALSFPLKIKFMAKKSVIARELKRQKIVALNKEKRSYLSDRRSDVNLSYEERNEAQLLLQKMPRNSSSSRLRNRCALTGRPRGVFQRFNLSRTQLREQAMIGNLPGLKKASW